MNADGDDLDSVTGPVDIRSGAATLAIPILQIIQSVCIFFFQSLASEMHPNGNGPWGKINTNPFKHTVKYEYYWTLTVAMEHFSGVSTL